MKKLFSMLITLLFTFLIMGCSNTSTTKTTDATTPSSSDTGSTNPTESTVPEKHYDFGGAEFVIVANDQNTANPRSDQYEGLYQIEKQQLMDMVEQKYNIKIKYVPYPSQASWGEARDQWIIQDVLSGMPLGQVYQISTVSVAPLAKAGAIMPLNDLINKYGSADAYQAKKAFGHFLNEYYVYDDVYPVDKDGLYYNEELLEQLGYEPNYPTLLWNQGQWNWDTFESFCKELNSKLDENAGQYPIGGKAHNYAYNFIAANGGTMVDDQLNVNIDKPEDLDAMDFLASLYAIPGMWIDDSDPSTPVQQQFRDGKVVFQDGQYWYAYVSGWLADRSFSKLGFVPYPVGPNVKSDLSNYYNVNVWGPDGFVLSNAYDPSKIPAGYETMFYSDEAIFKIWKDLQYFGDENDYKIDFSVELAKYYADIESVNAHLSIIDKQHLDFFYGFGADSYGQVGDSFSNVLENAIKEDNVRAAMAALKPVMQEKVDALKAE